MLSCYLNSPNLEIFHCSGDLYAFFLAARKHLSDQADALINSKTITVYIFLLIEQRSAEWQ